MTNPMPYTQTTDLYYQPADSEEKRVVFIQTYRQLCGMPGETLNGIAERLGISRSTIYLWRREIPEFADDMKRIEEANRTYYALEAEETIAEIMRSKNPADKAHALKAAMFMVERLNAPVYGNRTTHQHTGSVTVTVPRPQRPDFSAIDVTPASPALPEPEPELPVWHGDGPYDPAIDVVDYVEPDDE